MDTRDISTYQFRNKHTRLGLEIVEFDEVIDANTSFIVDGVKYTLEPTELPGMPGVNITIGSKVYYQHFVPAIGMHASKYQIKSKASIDAALVGALKAKERAYSLLLGSHGQGKADSADLDFQIKYLKTMKQIASNVTSEAEFIKQMKQAYPDCKGEEDLLVIAGVLFK